MKAKMLHYWKNLIPAAALWLLATSNLQAQSVRVPGFLPSTSGLHFCNCFQNVPYFTIPVGLVNVPIGSAANGMCGGMVFAVRDYHDSGLRVPCDRTAPSGGLLFNYLSARLFDSFNLPFGPGKYVQLMDPALPDHETVCSQLPPPFNCPHGRAWVMIREEWPNIKADLDNRRLSPMALIRVKDLNVFRMGENHQVLAYGYDMNGNDLTIFVYDPNHPDDDNVTISLNIGDPLHTTPVSYRGGVDASEEMFCFFRPGYGFVSPPAIPDQTAPVIRCPSSVSAWGTPGACSGTLSYLVTATDDCDGSAVLVRCNPPSGSRFPIGTTPVHCTATDAAGNASSCNFNATVLFNAGFVPMSCPPNQTVTAERGQPHATIYYTAPALDADHSCLTVQCLPPSGSAFPIGTTTASCAILDGGGAALSRCTFAITVNANAVPPNCAPHPMPLFWCDFNTDLLPRTALFGTARIEGGVLKLTTNQFGQMGSFIVEDFANGAEVIQFTATFKARVGGGTTPEADGFSFSFANDLPNDAFGEEGAGTGLSVCFDTWNNGNNEAPAIDVKWGGATVARRMVNPATGSRFVDVLIRLNADSTLDVSYDGAPIFQREALNYRPLAGGRFGLGARTGALTDNHFIDDLNISVPQRMGLVGEYFDNADLTGLRAIRTDPAINFEWVTGSPHPKIAPDTFSVRWAGQLMPLYSESYTFYTLSDDGVRLWVNGQLLINNWTDHGPTENASSAVSLVAGQKYDIRLEYYENGGGATMKLLWSSARQPKEVIPFRQLIPYPQAGTAFVGQFNTGVDASGLAMGDDARELHYCLAPGGGIAGSPFVATEDGGWPIGPWLASNSLSAWLSPTANTYGMTDIISSLGRYRYETHFDLTGLDPATAVIQGEWATDNDGVDIVLNGHSMGLQNTAQFTSWTPFVISTGFVPGINALTFIVNNGSGGLFTENPTGLRVEMCGTGRRQAFGSNQTLVRTTAGMLAVFATEPGRRYCLEYTDSIVGPWFTLSCATASDYTTAFTDASPHPTMRFYRLVLAP